MEKIIFSYSQSQDAWRTRDPGTIPNFFECYRASDVDAELERLHKYERFEEDRNRLVEVVKLFYRKHVLNDESIGWDELGNNLFNELAESLGDKEFVLWLNTQSR